MNNEDALDGVAETKQEIVISLMEVYLTEWMHRDGLFWKQLWMYFYASLIVMLVPNISSSLGVTLPEIPAKAFPIIGLLMALAFLYIALAYATRLKAVGDTYQGLINMLEKPLQRIRLEDMKRGRIFNIRISKMISWTMFAILMGLGLLLLII